MEIKAFIDKLERSNFSLSVENDRLLLNGDKKKLSRAEIDAIKKDHVVINYIKENKQELINFLSSPGREPDEPASKKLKAIYRLSGLQEGMLFHGLYDGGQGAYIEQFSCDLTNISIPAFIQSWKQVISKHTILRSAFHYDKFDLPVQTVSRQAELPVDILDYRELNTAQQNTAIKSYEDTDIVRGFDFKVAPLMRIALIRLAEDRYRMLWTSHHILFDGWSRQILMEELLSSYELILSGADHPPAEEDRYEDYIRYIERIDKHKEEAFWKNYSAKLEGPTLLPFLYTNKDRTKGGTRYESTRLTLSAERSADVQHFAQQNRLTVNTIMQGVWAYLLHQYTGNREVVYGVIVSGRPDDLPGVEKRVGLYINTLPLHSSLNEGEDALDWLQQLQASQVEARQYQHTPLASIQKWSGITGDLFDSLFVFENYPISKVISERQWSIGIENLQIREQTNYPLNLLVSNAGQISIQFSYNADLLQAKNIEMMKRHFEQVLLQMTGNNAVKLAAIEMLPATELKQVLYDFNTTGVAYPQQDTIAQLFETQVEKAPGAIAVSFEEQSLSYQQLNERANQLANFLAGEGVQQDQLVPICVERSPDMIVGVLAILKLGAVYVPIDPEYPAARIRYMLEETAAPVVLSNSRSRKHLVHDEATRIIELDTEWARISSHSTSNFTSDARPGRLAYILYTSGSTGTPKGVKMPESSLVNLLQWQEGQFKNHRRHVLQFASLNFDVSFQEIFSTLCFGSSLHLIDEGRRKDMAELVEDIRRYELTHLFLPYIVLKSLAEHLQSAGEDLGSIEEVIVAGEQLKITPDIAELLLKTDVKLVNQYGPTESHVVSSYTIENDYLDNPLPPIGKPVSNVQLYVLNSFGKACSVGVPGELYIGGAQLASGYLNRPELTSERFVPNTISRESSPALYKTGDLVRWLDNGNLEYLGRIDEQVKIRGFRVELGEIETALQQSGLVRQAVVLAKEDKAGGKRLVAYVLPSGQFDRTVLMAFLEERLPAYMVPGLWVEMEQFPTSPNGKLERRLLPEPDATAGAVLQYVEPSTELQVKLAAIWKDLLGVERPGIHDNFFDLGGHSLLAMRAVSAVRRSLKSELAIKDFFEHPTIYELGNFLSKEEQKDLLPPIQPVERNGKLELSFSQERLWFIDQFEGSAQYHIPAVLRLKGSLDIKALEFSLRSIVDRHEILRTVYREEQGQVYQYVQPAANWTLTVETPLNEEELPEQIKSLVQVPFDLSKDYVFRASIIALNDAEHLLVTSMHHIASDGWSVSIIVKEVSALYDSFVNNASTGLHPLPIQYADYAAWQRKHLQGPALEEKLAYWKHQLQGVSPLELPTDFPRPRVQSTGGSGVGFSIDKDLAARLHQLGREEGATLFMTLLAGFKLLLFRYSGQQDICVGTPIANRPQPELENLVGFFLNTLALRSSIDNRASFTSLLRSVRETTLQAYAHQEVPFEKVVETVVKERDMSRSPLFQVMFVLHNTPEVPELRLGKVRLSEESFVNATSKYDLIFSMTETPEGLRGSVQYSTGLYRVETIESMLGHFRELLESVTTNPNQQLGAVRMLDKIEEQALIAEFNRSEVAYPKNTLVDLFQEQAEKTPGNIALIAGKQQVTYQELNERANQLAAYLQAKGVQAETLVPICIGRSLEMMVGILGILKAGAAYVPVDPSYPEDRIRFMVEDAQAGIVLTVDEYASNLAAIVDEEHLLRLDSGWTSVSGYPKMNPPVSIRSNLLAYVLYTSGSTGKPKGVQVQHGSLAQHLHWFNHQYNITAKDSTLLTSSFSFDGGMTSTWPVLISGGQLHLSPNGIFDPEQVLEYIAKHSLTYLKTLPGIFKALIQAGNFHKEAICSSLRLVILGGERIDPVDLKTYMLRYPTVIFSNHYGPTECTVSSSFYIIDKNNIAAFTKQPLIGQPVDNTLIYVVNQNGQLNPIGVAGELYISGAGVARGYLNQPALTRQKFVADTFSETPGARMYKTGDLGRWLHDGNIEFLGRIDDQVKIRGYRIEPGEIENLLLQGGLVRQAVVLAKEAKGSNPVLVGYVVAQGNFNQQQVIELLKKELPDYMIPSVWVPMESMPLTPNGKVDRRALPDVDAAAVTTAAYVPPRNKMEEQLAQIWQQLLGKDRIGIHDNFFEIGGHSLLGMRVISATRKELKLELAVKDIFMYPTIAELAEQVTKQHISALLPAIEQQERPPFIPLSFSQERLWFIDQLEGSVPYHMPTILRLKGPVDIEALQKTLQAVVERHEVLRTVIQSLDGRPYQVVQDSAGWKLSVADVSGYTKDALQDYQQKLINKPFSLSKDFMLRADLLQLSKDEHLLVVTMHHIASDGWSSSVLVKEVVELYRHYTEGSPLSLQVLPIQYADFSIWQRANLQEQTLETKLAYWKEKLEDIAPLQLPTDFPRATPQSNRGHISRFMVDKEMMDRLQVLSRQQETSLFMTLLSAFNVLLYRYTNQQDICVGTGIAGRQYQELEGLIGFFVNTLALRTQVNGEHSFTEILQQVKQTTLEAYEHQDIPFEKVVDAVAKGRDTTRTPLFQVMFALSNIPDVPSLNVGALELTQETRQHTTAKFDLTFILKETPAGLRVIVEYATDLFTEITIAKMVRHFTNLLESITTDPGQEVLALPMLSVEELDDLREGSQGPEVKYSIEKTVTALFEEQVMSDPAARAVVFGDEELSYGELNKRANRLAHYLQQKGVGAEMLVPVCVERSAEMLVAILAILKTGAAYVPIDPDYPQERINYLLGDTRAELIICSSHSRSTIANFVGPQLVEVNGEHAEAIRRQPGLNIAAKIKGNQLAYVIYTSGSTGKPKGVMIEHKSLLNYLLNSQANYVNADTQTTGTFLHLSYTFDASLTGIFMPLIHGKTLVIGRGTSLEVFEDSNLRKHAPYDFIKITPSHLELLEATIQDGQDWLTEKLVIGGEALHLVQFDHFVSKRIPITVINEYGPTEATVGCSTYSFDILSNNETIRHNIPIGKPMDNVDLYIVDERNELLPAGVPGEICIGGEGLGRGYLNQPELTEAKFIAHPFSSKTGARLYKTGDLGRWLPGGDIEFLGRIDEQVKLKGYRIELGEIETAISLAEEVKQARVIVADTKLNAYVQVDKEKLPLLGNYERLLNAKRVHGSDLHVLPNGLPILGTNPGEVRFLYNEIFQGNSYLKHSIILHPESVVLELGTDAGLFATYLNVLSEDITVYSFEPNPEAYHFLSANRELYGVKGKAFQVAIMDVEKELEFTYCPQATIVPGDSENREQEKEPVRSYNKHSHTNELGAETIDSLPTANPESKTITVKTKTISQVIREEHIDKIDLLKIGAETSGLLVLKGLEDADWDKIGSIILEIPDVDDRLESIKQTLENKGFEIVVEKEQLHSGDKTLYKLFALKTTNRSGYTTLAGRDLERAKGWLHPQELVKNIQASLGKRLPGYMLPSNILLVDHFPLTRNGKLDKHALPVPGSNEAINPTKVAKTENEIALLAIWKNLLHLDEIGIDDNFFELGGDSMTAVRLVSLIRKELSLEIPIRSIFECPTIFALAGRLPAYTHDAPIASIKLQQRPAQVPLAFSQERLWFVDKLEGSLSYHLPAVLRLKGRLNVVALEHAVQEIINRHEVLRTVIYENNGTGYQHIMAPNTWKLDRTQNPGLINSPAQLQAFTRKLISAPFDLSKDHMLRATLIELSTKEFLLVVTMHHIASDGWSLSILVKEVVELYSAYQENRPALLPQLPVQFADFAIWQRTQLQGKALDQKLQYWQQKLEGTEPLLLPVDYARTPVQSNRGAVIPFTVDNNTTAQIRAFSQQQGSTLFMTLLAAFKVLMHRYSGQQDICVGTPVAGRQQEEIEGLIGFFLNTLALRTNVSSQQTFVELLASVKETTLDAYAHQDLPFEKVVDAVVKGRDLSRSPLFQVVFVLQNIPDVPDLDFAGVTLTSEAPAINTSKFEILCHVKETPEGLAGTFSYATDLFAEASIEQLVAHFKSLLNSITLNPAERVGHLSLLAPGEEETLVSTFNDTSVNYPSEKTIVDLFEMQAQKTPGQPALEFGDSVLTYRELNERANQLARYLKTVGVREKTFVPLCIERSVEMIVGLLAILKTGAAYVPIDPEYPQERIQYILDDIEAGIILSSSSVKHNLAFSEDLDVLELDVPFDMIDNQAVTNLATLIEPGQAAYVIFTSGSTGRPKGVLVPHRGNVNMSLDQVRVFDITSADKVFQFASIAFDASVSEIFMAFYAGATLVLPAKSMIQDTQNFTSSLRRSGVTVITLPPVYLKALHSDDLAFLRVLITAGEAADVEQASYLAGLTNYYNAYGPTEYSVCVSIYKVSPADKLRSRIPIGKPIANTRVYLLDEAMNLVPVGIPGEMYVAGAGIAIGYLHKPELTAEKFIINPFSLGEHLYRTGDIGRWLPDGNIEFLGRADDQVKIRGYRVELGEIEQTLNQHKDVDSSVVVLSEAKADKQLVAYFTPAKKITLWPSVAEFYVYDELLYKTMAGDEARNAKYRNAMSKVVKDKVVLEIGPGFEAILSRICIEAGAKKVYAVELLESSYLKAKETVEALGLEDRIIVIHGNILTVELPEKADYCISEIVGAIGGSEGSATLINSSRRLLKDPACMIPSRSLTKIAAITLPPEQFDNSFEQLGAYYTNKIFEQAGRKFDLRVYLDSFPVENIISTEDAFEDLDYTQPIPLEDKHDIRLTFKKDGVINGFIVWLNLYCDDEELIDTVNEKYTWLPIYFPVFDEGEPVQENDYIHATITRKISSNNLNPDFLITGTLYREGQLSVPFTYESLNSSPAYQGNSFYQKLFENDTIKIAQKADKESLREFIKSRLPDYMVPSLFIQLEEFPVTISGKIDKKNLPQPDFNTLVGDQYVRPGNELENKLVAIWQDVLEIEQVGVSDDFFELGGHSLLAIRLISVIRKELQMEVPIGLIFDNPTIESLAAQLSVQSSPELLPAITKQQRPQDIPLSFSQERMWFLDRLQGSLQHHVPAVLRLNGRLNSEALEHALQSIINRHEVLRSVIIEKEGQGYQVVLPEGQWSLFVINEPQYQQDAGKLSTLVTNLLSAPFDLSKDHMIRATLVTLGEEEHLLVVTMHHIASDGWSASIIVKELVESYNAYVAHRSPVLPEHSIQYADYAIWQRQYLQGAVLERKLAYWTKQLDGVTPLELPADFNRPSIQSSKGALARFQVDKLLIEKLEQVGQEQGATFFMTLLTAFNILLNRYSGQEDICIGTSVAGRQQKEVESLVGFFINTIVLRTSVQPAASFIALLQEVKATTLDAYANQEVPFEKVVDAVVKERDLSRNPLFQVMFVLQNTMEIPELKLGNCTLIAETKEHQTTQFDLTLNVSQSENGLFGSIQYSTELYTAATIERMIAHFKTLLEAIVQAPTREVRSLNILSAEERQQLLVGFNNTTVDFPGTSSIVALFEKQVAERPQEIALIFGETEISYEELNSRSNQLAHYLLTKRLKPEELVAVCMERSPEMIIAILAVLKAGGAYLPVDRDYPSERIDYMLEDSGARLMLTNSGTTKYLPARPGTEFIELDTLRKILEAPPSSDPQTKILPANLAYVIYTSGSTGKPKGVMIEHGGVVNLAHDQAGFLQLRPGLRTLQFASIGFDASCHEIFTTLLSGGSLVLCTREQLLSAKEFRALIVRHHIELATLPPSYLYNVADDLGTLKTIVSAGEALNEAVGRYIQSKGIRLINGYGPTENTIAVSYSDRPIREDHTVVIGRPVSNVQVYILDQHTNLLPVNGVGEICVGGAQVARGYLGRPELTAEKFVQDPFSKQTGARLYRTGDLGRWLPDGTLEYLGRIDEQVKIRGYRVEPGEIETTLKQHPAVGQVLVVAKNDSGHTELVAYIIPASPADFDRTSVQQYLRSKLPEYMVPARWVTLDQFPLTPNGKIDKKALPVPAEDATMLTGYVAPATELEIALAQIWETILPLKGIGTHENFFEAGGNSLLAMRVISLVRREFEIDIPIKELFLHPTISGLAEVMQLQLNVDVVPAIKLGVRPELIPLSFSQERLWFIDQMEGTVQYHIPVILRLRGNLNIAALRHALTEVVNRHESLRTVIREVEGQGYQYILPANSWELTLTEGAPYQDAEALREYVRTLTQAPFDLSTGHMLRAELIRLSDTEQVLVATMHHIASDGWSASILVREVVELYQSFTEQRPANLQPLTVQYADYALWQRNYLQGELWDNKLNYWKTKLDNAAALQLPTDHPRPAIQTTHGATASFRINKNIATQLQAFSHQQGATLFMTLLAGFKVLLHRYSGQEDITVGTPIANRTQHETEQLIGFFVNTLALRSEVQGDESFTELVQQVKTTTLEAYSHQDVPFEKVVETVMKSRDLSRSPLFQVMFVLQNTPDLPELKFGDVQLSTEGFTQTTAKYDLSLFMTDNGNGLQGSVEYNTDLYGEETIRQMMAHFEQLLLSVLDNPAEQVGRLKMLNKGEEEQLLNEFNDTETAYPQDQSIVSLFETQAAKTPEATALVFENETLTYRELNERSNQLAHYLQSRGVTTETLVPVCIERGLGMITAILGILKAGGAYVPIDPEYPQDRISYMLEDTSAKLVVSSVQSRSKLVSNTELEVIELDGANEPAITAQPNTNLGLKPSPGQLIYVIYTSGSTGKPKGVKMPAEAMVNLLTWQEKQFNNHQRKVLQFASLTFDVSFQEIFSTLCFGSTLYLIGADRRKDIAAMVRDIHSHGITHLFIPFIVLKSLAEYALSLTSFNFSLEEVIVAGEQLKLTDDIRTLLGKTNIRLVNQYGPTEAHVVSQYIINDIGTTAALPPIGKPIDNIRLYILNGQQQLSPPGVPGELYIGGAQVARGYLNKTGLTNEKFLADPFSDSPGSTLYRTGDLARWLPGGDLEYLGRIDDQVKIRGYRVELGEIESILQQHEQVKNAVVLAKEDSTGNKRLVAYVLAAEIFDKQELITWLKARLPEYMVPAIWVELQQLPQTPNGKVDRKALPDPDMTNLGTEYVAPGNEVEMILAEIWQEVLGVQRVGMTDNFFELGGHSLMVMKLVSQVKKRLSLAIPIQAIFQFPTIGQLSEYIDWSKEEDTTSYDVINI